MIFDSKSPFAPYSPLSERKDGASAGLGVVTEAMVEVAA